jgi:UDP-3-O-[3-hydroxymyristoyl] glucosamine N-acyltransferase
MKRTAEELAEFVGGRLEGRPSESIERVADLDRAGPGDLSYADAKFADKVAGSRASCVLVSGGAFPDKTTIHVENPKAAFARAALWLDPPRRPPAGIHETARVASDAEIGEDVSVGAWTVVGSRAAVGPSSVILTGCHIGSGCRIGAGTTIHPNVVLYPGVEIGDRVVLHAGVVIGSDGFGYVRDGDEYVKFPQVGGVKIEDDVEIGANTTIDRGSLGSTVIGRGAKIDNLCHVAHNVRIGARTVIAAQTGISGSVTIGDDAVIAGQVGIADHVRIDSGAVIGAQCGIPTGKRIRAGEVFWGTPARPLRDIKVQQAFVSRLPRMAEEVARLRRSLDELMSEDSRG